MLAKRDRLTLLVGVLYVHNLDLRNALGQLQGCFKAVRSAARNCSLAYKSIDNHFDAVVLVTSKFLILLEKL